MIIIPAIDLKKGAVVRLYQGKEDQEKIYSLDPVAVASMWQEQGAELIHIVDLDGAFKGKPQNLEQVKNIIKNVNVKIEFGGGVRDKETLKELFDIGVSKVVLGTRAIKDPVFLREVFDIYNDKIRVSIDTKESKVLIEGWQQADINLDLDAFLFNLKDIGLKELIFTDTLKDGTLKGPNIPAIRNVLKIGFKVIASGGVSSLEDIVKLNELAKEGVEGIIIGKALYEEKFDLKQAIELIKKGG